jgi:3-methyl-2-oxobutanoate hydroxymethyltransferase
MKGVDPITILTAYDYPTACAHDTCSLDILFVGDSLAQTELGLASTRISGWIRWASSGGCRARGEEESSFGRSSIWELRNAGRGAGSSQSADQGGLIECET